MIDSLSQLNEVVNNVVNHIVETSTRKTSTGNWIMEYEDVSDLISEQEYLKYFDLIANELSIREEVLDLDTSNHCLDAIYGLDYCPNYVWADGDEEIFGCDQDTWERTFHAVPVSQPLSMARLAEIGTQAISYVLENSDIAIEDLTESIGMSMAELKQLGIYDPGPDGPTDPIKFEVFDAQNRKTHTCDDIHTALDIYKSLGDSPFKSVDAVIPPGYTYSGRLLLMHQQAGKDVMLNIDTEQPQIQALHEHFSGTVVEDAFKAVNLYVKSQTPIEFFVTDNSAACPRPIAFSSFESALEHYQSLQSLEKSLSYQVYDEQGRGRGAFLLQSDERRGDMVCDISEEALFRDPHIALAASKARLAMFPNDEDAWHMRDQAEKVLGITDRMVDSSQDLQVGKWRVRFIPTDGHYGTHNQMINKEKPLVEFYDASADEQKFGSGGQFVSRFYVDTLLGRDGWSTGEYPYGLSLDADIPEWTVSAAEMKKVIRYLHDRTHSIQTRPPCPSLSDQIGNAECKKPSPMQEREDGQEPIR